MHKPIWISLTLEWSNVILYLWDEDAFEDKTAVKHKWDTIELQSYVMLLKTGTLESLLTRAKAKTNCYPEMDYAPKDSVQPSFWREGSIYFIIHWTIFCGQEG